jgi:DNA-binding SARP family transcriptional activator/tetratricopeptide (TPR) repeat protein
VEYRILGPVEVRVDGRPVPVGGPKPRALLVLLLLNANRVVPTAQVLEALWGGRPPASGPTRVQGVVSELRAALAAGGVEPGPVATLGPGYRLAVRDGQLDLDAFERGLREAERAAGPGAAGAGQERLLAAATGYRAALGRWRGPALTGVSASFAAAEAARLEERRLVAVERLMELELALGRHAVLAGELAALVARHPLRERPRELLMLALYRAGRQAEALAAYREAHRLLVAEAGLEPGPVLRELQRAILAGDPGLLQEVTPEPAGGPAAVVPPAQLPPAVADFTGRTEQVRRLCGALDPGPSPAAAPVATVSGAPGVGKSALAVHVAHRLRERFPDGQLHVDLGGTRLRPLAPAEVLDRFLRALGVGGAAVPATLEDRRDLYRSRLADRRVLVVLDDAADEAQVRPLLPGSPTCATLVTSRRRLAALDGALRLDLEVLEPDRATELLARIVGPGRVADEPEAAAAIIRLCGRLPLAVRVAGARLALRAHWRLADLAELLADERRRLDELRVADVEVRAGLEASERGLDPEGRRLLARLGLLAASSFTPWVAAAALDLPVARAAALLDGLADANLVEPAGPGAAGQGRYRLHDLVRLYARERAEAEEPAAARRAVLERALGAWLALAETAEPALSSGSAAAVHGAGRRQRLDPELSSRLLAQPKAWFEAERVSLAAMVRQACQAGLSELAWDLTVSVASFHEMTADGDWLELRRLADVAAAGDPRGRAALEVALGWFSFERRPPAKLEPVFDRARASFERLGDDGAVAEALLGQGSCLRLTGRLDQARACFRRAHRLAATTAAPHRMAAARFGMAMVDRDQGQPARALEHLRRVLPVWRERGARRWEVLTVRVLALTLGAVGDLPAAEDRFREALALAGALGDVQQELQVLIDQGVLRGRLGESAAAADVLELAARRAGDMELAYDQARALDSLGELHAAEGRLAAAERCLAESARLWRLTGIPSRLAGTLDRLGSVRAAAAAGRP